MQIRLLKRDDIVAKVKTRSLYEENFDFNNTDFIDYYYDIIIKRNEVVVIEEDNQIISMIHLNPYIYNICGYISTVHYFVALATKFAYRKKGYMSKAINFAINYLNDLNEPFCYILPQNENLENYYKKFGFEKVCKFTVDKFSKIKYDIFPELTKEYNNLMMNEEKFIELETDEYRKNLSKKNVMMKILNNNNGLSIEKLCSKKIYICQEV